MLFEHCHGVSCDLGYWTARPPRFHSLLVDIFELGVRLDLIRGRLTPGDENVEVAGVAVVGRAGVEPLQVAGLHRTACDLGAENGAGRMRGREHHTDLIGSRFTLARQHLEYEIGFGHLAGDSLETSHCSMCSKACSGNLRFRSSESRQLGIFVVFGTPGTTRFYPKALKGE